MIGCLKNFEDANPMCLLVKDEKLLRKKYSEIWTKLLINMKRKKFDSDQDFHNKYLKTKTKSYNNKIITNFKNIKNGKNNDKWKNSKAT